MSENQQPNRAAGGHARAGKLTPEERKASASKAALARWNKDLPRANHEGTLKFGSIEFKCAVVEKPDGTVDRIVSQSEFMAGLGMYYSGFIAKQHREQDPSAELPMFLAQSSLKPFVESNIDVLQFKPWPK